MGYPIVLEKPGREGVPPPRHFLNILWSLQDSGGGGGGSYKYQLMSSVKSPLDLTFVFLEAYAKEMIQAAARGPVEEGWNKWNPSN